MTQHAAVVLAAGKGTRMESDLPKVIVPVLGRPMIGYVIDALETAGVSRVLVVIGYRGELVREELAGRAGVEFVEQPQQLGTGDAVKVCRDALADHNGSVIVVTGDSPMIQVDSVRTLLDYFEQHQPACLLGTAHRDDPTGLGRIVRNAEGDFEAIVEEKDATDGQRQITEVNMSTYVFDRAALFEALAQIEPNNLQQEYYLTDCPGLLRNQGRDVRALPVLKPVEALSINNLNDLAAVEDALRSLQ